MLASLVKNEGATTTFKGPSATTLSTPGDPPARIPSSDGGQASLGATSKVSWASEARSKESTFNTVELL